MRRRYRRFAVTAPAVGCALIAAALASPAAASATPPSGLRADTIGAVTIGGTTVTARHIVFDPGGTTGWHSHQGPVYALVTEGTLARTLADCSVAVSSPGDIIAEGPGAHIGTARGAGPVELWAVYVEPKGAPLADDAAAVDCPLHG